MPTAGEQMTGRYILVGKEVVPEPDLYKWAQWFETNSRIVRQDIIANKYKVSTVFLGLDHAWREEEPQLFETMIFIYQGSSMGVDDYQTRCSTWEEAEKMHQDAIDYITNKGFIRWRTLCHGWWTSFLCWLKSFF